MCWTCWTGPYITDYATFLHAELREPVPPWRWPYGPPEAHSSHCNLHPNAFHNQLFCDCKASAADGKDD